MILFMSLRQFDPLLLWYQCVVQQMVVLLEVDRVVQALMIVCGEGLRQRTF